MSWHCSHIMLESWSRKESDHGQVQTVSNEICESEKRTDILQQELRKHTEGKNEEGAKNRTKKKLAIHKDAQQGWLRNDVCVESPILERAEDDVGTQDENGSQDGTTHETDGMRASQKLDQDRQSNHKFRNTPMGRSLSTTQQTHSKKKETGCQRTVYVNSPSLPAVVARAWNELFEVIE